MRSYLADRDPLKLYQLAAQIARLFDQYLVYRPAMVERWARGKEKPAEAWQAMLWREIHSDSASPHLEKELAEAIAARAAAALPPRVFAFGLTTLPPAYVAGFFHLARHCDVHLHRLQPSREYHGDDLTPRERARRGIAAPAEASGNPLLTSFGRLDAHFTELLLETEDRLGASGQMATEHFPEPTSQTLLATVQRDILTATQGDEDEAGSARPHLEAQDRSVAIHSCHSPMREVEVLYDQLLDLLARDSTLRPRDILVMSPEIERYAPLIRAVFEFPEVASRKIPYSISDRVARSDSPVIETFLSLLALVGGRRSAPEIFGLLTSRLLQIRFGFTEDDLEHLRAWIDQAGIRWGIDAEDRQRVSGTSFAENSWRAGLDRLLLGYAMRGNGTELFEGILPFDEIEGDLGELLGRLVSACEIIFAFLEEARTARSLAEWSELLLTAVDQILPIEGEELVRDLHLLRRTLAALGETKTDNLPALDFAVVRYHLEQVFAGMEQRGSFFTGGVTFCALKPARSLPARVIVLLGLNNAVFPRHPQPAQFDLMAASPQLGDPSPRDDDRYAFLETLVSARERLLITYIGRSNIHNEEIPPSVVVSELLDYLDERFTFAESKDARAALVVEHPLHAFSPLYFSEKDSPLFSYSQANAQASASVLPVGERAQPWTFFTGEPLDESAATKREFTLDQLVRFFSKPGEYFLKNRFGIDLRDFETCMGAEEPFDLDSLDQWSLEQILFTQALAGEIPAAELCRAAGKLPIGAIGAVQFERSRQRVQDFAGLVLRTAPPESRGDPQAVRVELADAIVTGTIRNLYGGKLVRFRCAKLKGKDYVAGWLEHLALSAAGVATETILLGVDKRVSWPAVPDASAQLSDLVALATQGLSRPLPFFLRSALAYVSAGGKTPMSKALKEWNGGEMVNGEKKEPANAFLFGEDYELGEEFEGHARAVFSSMLATAEEEVF